eukprot:COSAG01_NODE_45539_length_408_cov_1.524272_1_plen_72_part_10
MCQKEHSGSYGSGRFCNEGCKNRHSAKQKKRTSAKGTKLRIKRANSKKTGKQEQAEKNQKEEEEEEEEEQED